MKTLLSIVTLFFSFSLVASAATVSVVVPENLKEGQNFSVLVELDTSGVLINSFDIKLSYPKDIVKFSGYKEDGSIKRIWLTPPSSDGSEVHFSGIIPGGVDGMYDPDKVALQPLPLIQLLFSAKSDGSGTFAITFSEILKNDGKGTPLAHSSKDGYLSVSNSLDRVADAKNTTLIDADIQPPENFDIQFIPASLFSKTPSMVIFFTTDKDTGIEKYQLKTLTENWKDIMSPLQVTKSILKRDMTIRAVDFSGNIKESHIEIPGFISNTQFFGIIILGSICYCIRFVLKRKR